MTHNCLRYCYEPRVAFFVASFAAYRNEEFYILFSKKQMIVLYFQSFNTQKNFLFRISPVRPGAHHQEWAPAQILSYNFINFNLDVRIIL